MGGQIMNDAYFEGLDNGTTIDIERLVDQFDDFGICQEHTKYYISDNFERNGLRKYELQNLTGEIEDLGFDKLIVIHDEDEKLGQDITKVLNCFMKSMIKDIRYIVLDPEQTNNGHYYYVVKIKFPDGHYIIEAELN
jgi:hypothetical protein